MNMNCLVFSPCSFKSCHASKNGSSTCYMEDRFLYMFHEVCKPRKTICALQSIGMGRVSTKLDCRVGPLCSPAVPALPAISWMNRSVVWCCLRMAQVSSCNSPSITRRNRSVGEKEKGLPKKGALKPGMLLLRVAPWRDSQAGGELAQKMPIKESKERMAPRCFDPVFKDALWASSSSARQSPCGASPGVYGHCWGCGTGQDSKWGEEGLQQLPMWGSLADPSPLTRSMLAFFGCKHRAKAIQFTNLVLSPWNCTEEGLEGDYWGCPFAPRLVLLHLSLQGHRTFMVAVAECNQDTSFSSSCWQGLAAASGGCLNLLTAPAHGTSGFGWQRGDLSSLLQVPRQGGTASTAWPLSSEQQCLCWGRRDSWELRTNPPLEVNRELLSRLILSFCWQRRR